MIKQCKCGNLILGQNDLTKKSVAVVWKKNKTESGFVMQYQRKDRHWECWY